MLYGKHKDGTTKAKRLSEQDRTNLLHRYRIDKTGTRSAPVDLLYGDKVDKTSSVPVDRIEPPLRIGVLPRSAKVTVEVQNMPNGNFVPWPKGEVNEETHDSYYDHLYTIRFRMIEGASFFYAITGGAD